MLLLSLASVCSGGQLGRTGVRPKRERGEESHCGRGRQPPRIPCAAGYAPVGSDRPPWIIASTAASGECNDLEVGGAKRQEVRVSNLPALLSGPTLLHLPPPRTLWAHTPSPFPSSPPDSAPHPES
ncbi:uncharacterized protein LOC144463710 [Epinephelus lanceolatus]